MGDSSKRRDTNPLLCVLFPLDGGTAVCSFPCSESEYSMLWIDASAEGYDARFMRAREYDRTARRLSSSSPNGERL